MSYNFRSALARLFLRLMRHITTMMIAMAIRSMIATHTAVAMIAEWTEKSMSVCMFVCVCVCMCVFVVENNMH